MRIILSLCFIFAMALTINLAITRTEVKECRTWQAQAKNYNSFYLTQWQAKQCQAHGIVVDAPINH